MDLSTAAGRSPQSTPLLKRLELYTDQGRPLTRVLQMGGSLTAYIYFNLDEPTSSLDAWLGFNSILGQRVFTAHSVFEPQTMAGVKGSAHKFLSAKSRTSTLIPGDYKLKVALNRSQFRMRLMWRMRRS